MLIRKTEVLAGQLKSAKEALAKCKGKKKQLKRRVKTKYWDHKKVGFISKCKNHAKSKGMAT